MCEIAILLGFASAIAYLVIGTDLLHSVGRPGSGFEWDEPPTPFRKSVVVLCWPAVLVQLKVR